MEANHLLLGRSWQYDRDVVHNGVTNKFSFVHKGKKGYHHTFVSKWGLWGSNKNKSEKRTRKRRREKFVKKDENKKERKIQVLFMSEKRDEESDAS